MSRTGLRLAAAALIATAAACGGRAPGEPAPGVGSTSTEWADVRIRWTLLPSPDHRLRVQSSVTNVGDVSLERELPRCLNRIRLYRGDALLWDRAGAGDCFGLRWVRLAPHESQSFRTGLTAAEVLGDSIAPGEYTVRVHVAGRDRPGLPRADMELTLGRKLLRPE